MSRINGYYEWDDEELIPGQKREGGLHQNLYDQDGKLKGSARFVPDDGTGSEPLVVTETVYVPVDQRRKTREQEELEEAIGRLISHLIDRGIAKARPVVDRWWQETARPAIDTQWARLRRRPHRLSERKSEAAIVAIAEPECESLPAATECRPNMSKAEAQARYLAALAARAYSDEQMRLVASATIIDGGGIRELQHSLAQLPPEEVRALLEAMATDPNMLDERTLAELASILARRDRSDLGELRQLRSAGEAG